METFAELLHVANGVWATIEAPLTTSESWASRNVPLRPMLIQPDGIFIQC